MPSFDWAAAGFGLLLGGVLGSFLNVWALSCGGAPGVWRGRSCCPICGRALTWRELVPIYSFLAQRGRCRSCGGRLSRQYLTAEALGALAAGLVLGFHGPTPAGLGRLALAACLLAVSLVDWREHLIPDMALLPAALIGLVLADRLPSGGPAAAILAGLACAAGLWLLAWLYRRLRGREGLGLGDVKLGALLGLYLGLDGAVWAILLGSLSGLVYFGLLYLRGRHDWDQALPLGPFLAAGAGLVLVLECTPWAYVLGVAA